MALLSVAMNDTNLIHSDSWVLISVIYASQNSTTAALTDIIASADYLNHAIITRNELEIGIAHLVGKGYLRITSGGLSISDAVKSFWQTTGSKHRQALKAWDAVAAYIGVPSWSPGPLPYTNEERYVSTADYEAAVEAYQSRMQPQMKPTKK